MSIDATLTIKGYGGVGDTTGTAASFVRVSGVGKAVRYGLSTNTPSDSTYLDVKYQDEQPKRIPVNNGTATTYVLLQRRKFLVKISRKLFNGDQNRWDNATCNLTLDYPAELSTLTLAHLKDLVGYASQFTGVTANITKLFAQEA
jgi:hypothetical protein